MFTICTADKSKIRFRAEDMSINQSLLDLCVGTHNLYLRRRQPDLLEVQQMRIQAQELAEQTRLQREREQRVQAESERDKLRTELGHLAEQLNTMQIVMKNAEESHQLIAERARISEQEVFEMTRRANDAEAEMQRIRHSQLRAEERKLALERKYKDAELLANRLIQQQQQFNNNSNNSSNGPPPYHEQLRRSNPCSNNSVKHIATNSSSLEEETTVETDEGVDEGNIIEHLQQQQFPLINGINGGNSSLLLPPQPPPPLPSTNPPPTQNNNKLFTKMSLSSQQRKHQQKQNVEDFNGINNNGNGNGGVFASLIATEQQRQTISNELQHIIASTYAELEQSRGDWQAKDHSLREKLADFRLELEALKKEGMETEQDKLFAQKVAATGCFDKHSTLRKSGFGSSKSKAKMFDEMTHSKLTSNTTTTKTAIQP
ncbi:unnamed protein product [Meloidogyne enterolobii]|uniref:Uncharacterized protein n=1 Tax=Meloidogyne enterolobii TaxID=390850 RepID=A0ACB1B882_MELEN